MRLPEVDVAGRQPLQSCHIQDRQLVSCQAELLQRPELLQDGRHTAEAVERQAQVGQALQGAQLSRQRAEEVPVQEESPQAGHKTRGRGMIPKITSDGLRNELLRGWRPHPATHLCMVPTSAGRDDRLFPDRLSSVSEDMSHSTRGKSDRALLDRLRLLSLQNLQTLGQKREKDKCVNL